MPSELQSRQSSLINGDQDLSPSHGAVTEQEFARSNVWSDVAMGPRAYLTLAREALLSWFLPDEQFGWRHARLDCRERCLSPQPGRLTLRRRDAEA